ncbi:MAG: glycosyltransferase [bacterium]|nr:glycosyltransferase [bacterium]
MRIPGPRVTAYVSAYRSARFLQARLENLLHQTLYARGELEIVVIDSHSPEDERSIVESFQVAHPAIVYRRTDVRETVYAAWNRAIALASGRYLINANSDDRFALDALERLADALDEDSTLDAVYGDWLITRVENDTFDSATPKTLVGYPDFEPPLLLFFQITSHAALVRRSCFDRIGLFDPRYKVYGDREWMLRFALAGLRARHLPHVIGLYLESPSSVERASQEAVSEGQDLRDHHLAPERLWRLLGWSAPPLNSREQARACALLGAYGVASGTVDGKPARHLVFAARCFDRALEHDAMDPVALNNLGVIQAVSGKPHLAEALLLKAMPFDDYGEVAGNLALVRSGCREFARYRWRSGSDFYFRDRFHVVLSSQDAVGMVVGATTFVEAFTERDPVVLTVLAHSDLDRVAGLLPSHLEEAGLDLASAPEIRIVPGPVTDPEWPPYLEVADLVLGDPEMLERATRAGIPTLSDLRVATLQATCRFD